MKSIPIGISSFPRHGNTPTIDLETLRQLKRASLLDYAVILESIQDGRLQLIRDDATGIREGV